MDEAQYSDLTDKYLRLKKRSMQKLITLPPKYLGNVSKGIDEAIFKSNEEIFKEFSGVPISIGKKLLLQNVATSIDDYPYLQFNVNVECIVFCPKLNQKVRAVVHKVGTTFIGCLICNKINATIFRNQADIDGTENISDDMNANNWELNNLQIGQNILIKIRSIKYEHNEMFLIAEFYKSLD